MWDGVEAIHYRNSAGCDELHYKFVRGVCLSVSGQYRNEILGGAGVLPVMFCIGSCCARCNNARRSRALSRGKGFCKMFLRAVGIRSVRRMRCVAHSFYVASGDAFVFAATRNEIQSRIPRLFFHLRCFLFSDLAGFYPRYSLSRSHFCSILFRLIRAQISMAPLAVFLLSCAPGVLPAPAAPCL